MDIRPLAERVGEALKSRAPEHNRSGWISRMADEIGVKERTFKSWFYGEGVPGLAAFGAMCRHPEIGTEFGTELLGGFGLAVVQASSDEHQSDTAQRLLAQTLDELRDISARLENGGGR